MKNSIFKFHKKQHTFKGFSFKCTCFIKIKYSVYHLAFELNAHHFKPNKHLLKGFCLNTVFRLSEKIFPVIK